jgi:hypothetical protein
LANLSFLNCPTALASSYIIKIRPQQSHKKLRTESKINIKRKMEKKIEITDKELARIRPSRLVKTFYSNPAIIFLELPSVNYIGSFLSVL